MPKCVFLLFTVCVFCWSNLIIWLGNPVETKIITGLSKGSKPYQPVVWESKQVFHLSKGKSNSCEQASLAQGSLKVEETVCFTESGERNTYHRIHFYKTSEMAQSYRWERSSDNIHWAMYDSAKTKTSKPIQLITSINE